jgi:hypothetical protein
VIRQRIIAATVTAATASAVVLTGSTSQAFAAGESGGIVFRPSACAPDVSTTVSKSKSAFIPDNGKKVYGDSGVTLSLSVASGHTWTGSVSGTGEVDESAVVIAAKESVSASISYAKTTTVTLGGSWTVPASQSQGWFALGSQGFQMSWKRTRTKGDCSGEQTLGSGTAKLPAKSPYLAHS